MVDDAIIRVGSDVAGAIAGMAAVGLAVEAMEGQVLTAATTIASATATMGAAFIGLGTAAATLTVGGIGMAVDAFTEYEQAIANAASVTGAFGDEYYEVRANLEDIAQTLGTTTVFSAQQAADALYDLASAGYDVGTMTADDLRPILALAAATQNDLKTTTELVTATLGQFQMSIEGAGTVADIFVGTITSSKATLEKLGLSMKYVGTIAHQFGVSVEDTSAALAIMYNNGLRGEQAGRALRIAYSRMANPTQDVIDVVSELGLTIEDINAEGGKMNDVLMLLASRGATVGQVMRFFGVEAGTGMGAVVENTPILKQFAENLGDVGGLAEQVAEKQLDTLNGQLTLLKSIVNIVAIEIGRKFAPYIIDIIDILREWADIVLNNIDPAFEQLKKYVADLQPTWDALYSSIESIIGISQDLAGENAIGWLIDSINTMTTAVALALQFFDEHPIVLQFAKTVMVASVMFVALEAAIGLASIALGVYESIQIAASVAGLILNGILAGTISLSTALAIVLGFIESPLLLIAAAVAIFAAAWYTNFGGVRDFTSDVIEGLKTMFWDLVDAVDSVMFAMVDRYNSLMDAIGMSDKKIKIKGFKAGMEQALKNASDNIDYYIKDPLSEAFTLDSGGLSLFNNSELEVANAIVEEMTANSKEMLEANVASSEAIQEALTAYAASGKSGESGSIRMPAGYSSSDEPDVIEFGSYADVQAARAAGTLKPGTVYEVNVNIDNVNSGNDGGDTLGSVIDEAVSSAGGVK